jgi:hypothetical protein
MSPTDKVIIDVKALEDLDADNMQKRAEMIRDYQSWRYELSVVHPHSHESSAEANIPASEESILRMLLSAELLAAQNQPEAAALIASSALEATLRRRARIVAPEYEHTGAARILHHFEGVGLVAPDVHETLRILLQVRDALVHGLTVRGDPRISKAIDDVRYLQGGLTTVA